MYIEIVFAETGTNTAPKTGDRGDGPPEAPKREATLSPLLPFVFAIKQ